MQKKDALFLLCMAFLASSLFAAGCQSPYFADRGAAVGAVTGGLAGLAIGEHNHDPAAGAVIGSAVGALTGAAIGDAIDQDVARSQAIIEQQMGRRLAGAVQMADVMAMSQAGLSDQVIITHIRANGVAQPPGAGDLITLRNAGVSDAVIQTVQQTPPPQLASPPVAAAPVIVEEHHYLAPAPFRPYWGHHFHHHPRHGRHRGRPGVHWGISIRN